MFNYCPVCNEFRPRVATESGDEVCLVCGANFTVMDLMKKVRIEHNGKKISVLLPDSLPEDTRYRALNIAMRIITAN